MKDFFRFYAATSRGKIVEKPTTDSVNTFAEWVFAGFAQVTGTPTNDDGGSGVYNVSFTTGLAGAATYLIIFK